MKGARHTTLSRPRNGLIAVIASGVPLSPVIAQVEFVPLGFVSGSSAGGYALSPDGGTVVGLAQAPEGYLAVRWTSASGWQVLGDLPGGQVFNAAWGVSFAGLVSVGVAQSAAGYEACLWRSTSVRGLGDLPGGPFDSGAWGVSADGRVVVGFGRSTPVAEAVRWVDGRIESLAVPGHPVQPRSALATNADGSTIIGSALVAENETGFVWRSGSLSALSGLPGMPLDCGASAVSADGRIIVGQCIGPEGSEAVLWTNDLWPQRLGDLPGGYFSSSATHVSGDGRIVLGASIATGNLQDTFVWDSIHGMRSLKGTLESLYGVNLDGWRLFMPTGVSIDGSTILGIGMNPAGQGESWLVRGLRPFCYANCDGSEAVGGIPTLTLADFGCFQAKYVLGDMLYADCNLDDRLSVADFGCFQNKYVLGCP